MKLYGWSVAPNPRRVAIFLAEKAIDLEVVDVGDSDGWARVQPDFLDRFPHRRVPLLELDDGDWIAETPAICRYLESLHPDPPLMGRGAREIAAVAMWDRIAEMDGLMVAGEVYWNTSRSFAGRGLPGSPVPLAQIPELAERGKVRFRAFYERLEAQLGGREFLAADVFTLADITALCAIDFGALRKLDIPPDCPAVARWYDAVSRRPAVRTTARSG